MQKINLFISHYECGDEERQKELDFCLDHNKKSLLFSIIRNFDNRPTYDKFFELTKEYPNDINILANADIYFNDTINLTQGIGKKECYALTRWEEEGDQIVPFETKHSYNKQAHAKHSQDVWVFNGYVNIKGGNFHLGRPVGLVL